MNTIANASGKTKVMPTASMPLLAGISLPTAPAMIRVKNALFNYYFSLYQAL